MKNLNYNTVKLFKIDGTYYAYDIEKVYIWPINSEIYDVMQYIKKFRQFPKNSRPDVSLAIMKKIRDGFFRDSQPVCPPRKVKIETLIVSFPLLHICNLKCRYCFADSGRAYQGHDRIFSKKTIDSIIQFITAKFSDIKQVRLEFVSGGEPLLMKDLFFSLVSHFKSQLDNKGFLVDIFLLTNGTTLNKSDLDRLVKLDIALALSIDGPKEIHDYHRPYKDGEGSYARVMNTVMGLHNNPYYKNHFWIVSVITAKTPDLISILIHHKNLGIKSIEMRVMRGINPKDLALNEQNLPYFSNLYNQLCDYLKKHPDDLRFILNDFDTFGKIVKRLLLKKGVPCRCTAGFGKFSFTAGGDIYPCDSFVGMPEFVLGNIFDASWNGDLASEFDQLHFLSGKHMCPCDSCSIRYVCGSDCHFNAYVNNGSLWNKKSAFCKFQEHLFYLAVDLLMFIQCKDETLYRYYYRFCEMQNIISR